MVARTWRDVLRQNGLLSAIAAILTVQLLYWLALLPAFSPTPFPHDKLELIDSAHAELPSPHWQDVVKAQFEPVQLPWESCCKAGYHAIRTHFILQQVPDEGLALIPMMAGDNFRIHVNGSLLFGEGRMSLPDQTYDGGFRGTIRMPSGLLKKGRNEIVMTLVRGPAEPYFFVGEFTVGPYSAAKRHYKPREFMLNDYGTISITLAFFVAALAFFGWLRGGRSAYLGWLTALSLSWGLSLLFFELTDPPLRDKWRYVYMIVVSNLRPIAWLNLANNWGSLRIAWLGRVSMALFAICSAVLVTFMWFGLQDGLDTVYTYTSWITTFLSFATVVILLRKMPGLNPELHWEFAIYVLICTLMVHDGLNVIFDLTPRMLMDMAVPIFLAALVIAFLARNIRLFQSSEQINELLQGQLTQRTSELEAAHLREKELVRTQAHQSERQRIMRDMHDGLGSQLMSMLLAARRGVAKPAAVAEGLQSVIDEMRLLIDSMDSVGESLGSAFALFRDRMKDRVETAGLVFKWHDDSDGRLPDLGPRDVLQVFRIMQEAVTNALKHSGGSTLGVTISPSVDPAYAIRIGISDDGKGMKKANPRGKGMASMAARAETIGARIETQSTADGVRVFLDLPNR